jgi:hypothetical protein
MRLVLKNPTQDVSRILLYLRVTEAEPGLGIEGKRLYLTHLPVSFAIPSVKLSTPENECTSSHDRASKAQGY